MTPPRRPLLVLAGLVALAAAVQAGLRMIPPERRSLEGAAVYQAIIQDSRGPALGSRDADVLVVVFTDYRCGVCRASEPALARLVRNDPRVRVVYKEWAILGAGSVLAARTALAADRQGRYAPVRQALMNAPGALTADQVQAAAQQGGVDLMQLRRDLARDAAEIDDQLARADLQAWSLGLEGTPGYLVGPYLIKGRLDDRTLAQAVADVRRRARS